MLETKEGVSENMAGDSPLKNLYIILLEPRIPENVGSSARACANFGVENLIIVNPINFDWERAKTTATRIGLPVLQRMKVYDNLSDAVKGLNYLIGTTARLGHHRKVHSSLKEAAPRIASMLIKNRVGLLFGNEKWGLTNQELYMCNEAITIPTHNSTSLNLSHSVAVCLYEIYQQALKPSIPTPELATLEDQKIMYDYIRRACEAINFVPHHNTELWMTNIKRLLSRIQLSRREAKIITGFCRRIIKVMQK